MEDKSCPQLRKIGKWNNWGGGIIIIKGGLIWKELLMEQVDFFFPFSFLED